VINRQLLKLMAAQPIKPSIAHVDNVNLPAVSCDAS